METLISPERARQIVLQNCAPLTPEIREHAAVLGFTLARDIVANTDLPPFDNSSVDGFAVVASETRAITPQNPQLFSVTKTIAAGDSSGEIQSEIEYSNDANAVANEDEIAVASQFANANSNTPEFANSNERDANRANTHETEYSNFANSGEDALKSCAKIMTGAPLPNFADAVIMREETDESDVAMRGIVQILTAAQHGQNVRRRGSDVARGETVMRAGTKIGAAQWGMLASLGCAQIGVFPRPRVGLIATGNELVGVDATLQNGQIRDANSWTLRALVEECGAEIVLQKTASDDAEAFRETLLSMLPFCDVILTSGGVSAGDFDVVRDVLPTISQVHFWKISMKPGKPVMFATYNFADATPNLNANFANHEREKAEKEAAIGASETGQFADASAKNTDTASGSSVKRNGKIADFSGDDAKNAEVGNGNFVRELAKNTHKTAIFGLPGNPVSVMVSFERFVRPALLQMQGRRVLERVTLQVRVLDALNSPRGRTEFARALVSQDENGVWTARLDGDQGSGRLSTMTNSNALLEIPADTIRVERGDVLCAFMTDWA